MPPKITVKKNLIIFHHRGDWIAIYSRILADHGMGMAVRTRLRRELGFTYRDHQHWVNELSGLGGAMVRYPEEQVHLDFYNEAAQTWFQLRYLHQDSQVDQ